MLRTLHPEPGTSAHIPRNLFTVFKINYFGCKYQNGTSSAGRLCRVFCGWNRWRSKENFYKLFELANLWMAKECQLRSCAVESPIVKFHPWLCRTWFSNTFWFSVNHKVEQNYRNVVQAAERHEVKARSEKKIL